MKNKKIRDFILKIIFILFISIYSIITFIPLFIITFFSWIFNDESFVETYEELWSSLLIFLLEDYIENEN